MLSCPGDIFLLIGQRFRFPRIQYGLSLSLYFFYIVSICLNFNLIDSTITINVAVLSKDRQSVIRALTEFTDLILETKQTPINRSGCIDCPAVDKCAEIFDQSNGFPLVENNAIFELIVVCLISDIFRVV